MRRRNLLAAGAAGAAAMVPFAARPACGAASARALPYTPISPLRIVTLGDSITYGAAQPAGPTTGYRRELSSLLHYAGVPHVLTDRSMVGADVGRFLQAASPGSGVTCARQIAITDAPHLVVLALGTNDAAQVDSLANFEARYGRLVNELLAGKPDVKIVAAFIQISGPVGPSVNSSFQDAERQVNDAVYRTIFGSDAPFGSPLKPPFVGVCQFNTLPSGLLRDGVHPTSPLGEDIYGWIVFDQIAAWLGLPTS